MIVGIPTPGDFEKAGLSFLHLAWIVAVKSLQDLEQADELIEDGYADKTERAAAHNAYWVKKQPSLRNAFALIQQGIELGLKGRIAAVSPYLLIARDARDYPSGSDQNDTEFSAFRSLDAADLSRVHNTHCPSRLTEDFRQFWEKVRRQRNALMHSVAASQPITANELLAHVLHANSYIFGDVLWPARRLRHHTDDEFADFSFDYDFTRNELLAEADTVLRSLLPKLAKAFYGFDKKQRTYLCPRCYDETDHHFRDDLSRLAQLRPKSATATTLWCPVCEQATRVVRDSCTNAAECKSNVICDDAGYEGMCLICERHQIEAKR